MGMFKTSSAPPIKAATKPTKAAPKKAATPTRQRAADTEDYDDGDGSDDGAITVGFGGAKKLQSEYGTFATRLSMKEETLITRFGDDNGPYANTATHWFNKRKGKISFMCLGSKICPVCATGDRPRVTYCYNIIALTDGDPICYSGEWGIKVHKQIEKIFADPKKQPLTKYYYELERTGLKQDDTTYTFKIIRRISDIADEYPTLRVPSEAEIAKVKRYTKEDAKKGKPSMKEMEELAAELTGEADDVEEED